LAVAALLLIGGCTHHDRRIPARYVKEWGRHGEGLTITANGTGELSYRMYRDPDGGGIEYVTMRFRMSPDGRSLIATATAVRDEDGDGHPIALSREAHVGDEWVYTLKSDGALDEHQTRPPAPSGSEDLAFCTDAVEDPACGA
jgi:hypothetical protein